MQAQGIYSAFCYALFMEYNTPIYGKMQLFVTISI